MFLFCFVFSFFSSHNSFWDCHFCVEINRINCICISCSLIVAAAAAGFFSVFETFISLIDRDGNEIWDIPTLTHTHMQRIVCQSFNVVVAAADFWRVHIRWGVLSWSNNARTNEWMHVKLTFFPSAIHKIQCSTF